MMKTEKEKASYGIGMSIAESLSQQGLSELDLIQVTRGMTAIFDGTTPEMTPEEANGFIQKYLNEQKQLQFESVKKAGEDFLTQNSLLDHIISTESGLQYEVLEEGSGAKPNASSQVTVHYHGTLIDGTVFDSSVQRGEPATFGVNQVIKGWTEALQLMACGSKYRLYIPQQLAYGANPHPGGAIEPYATLIFDVELISIS